MTLCVPKRCDLTQFLGFVWFGFFVSVFYSNFCWNACWHLHLLAKMVRFKKHLYTTFFLGHSVLYCTFIVRRNFVCVQALPRRVRADFRAFDWKKVVRPNCDRHAYWIFDWLTPCRDCVCAVGFLQSYESCSIDVARVLSLSSCKLRTSVKPCVSHNLWYGILYLQGIVSYEWSKAPSSPAVGDLQGTNSPNLKVSNMVVGDYTFILKVTDTGGQTASSKVTVVVQPEKNTPPVAEAGSDKVQYCHITHNTFLSFLL